MRSASGLALVLAGMLAATANSDVTGNVNGVAEQPHITELDAIIALENEAKLAALGGDQAQPLDSETGSFVTGKLNEALSRLGALKTAVETGGPYQDTTLADKALKDLGKAEQSDTLAKTKIEKNKPAEKVVHDIERANEKKVSAKLFLMGLSTTPKDAAALNANYNAGPQTVVVDADISGNANAPVVSKKDVEAGRGDAVRGRGRRKKKTPQYSDLHAALSVAAFKPAADYYYAYEGTASESGYTFKTFGRDLFGPFDTHFQVGAFDPDRTEDTGSACIEFDLKGSSPLEFVAICGRRISGGVQIFVQTHDGAAGIQFFAGAQVVQVLVTYSGTQFVVKAAAGQFAPDEVMTTVATVNYEQGETALVAGMGASGLTKGAEIGIDEVYIDAK
jgi:primosomal protein N''